MFAALARFDVRFRWPIVTLWVLGGIAAIRLLPSLPAVNTFANVQVVPVSAPSQQANRLAEPFQGRMAASSALNPQTAILVASRASGALGPADHAAMSRLEQQARAVSGISLVRDGVTSPDGRAREVLVVLTAQASQSEALSDAIVREIRARAVGAPVGLAFHLTGPIATGADASTSTPSGITASPSSSWSSSCSWSIARCWRL